MAYRELLPHPALQPFVDRFWILSAAAGAGPRRILPDGCIDVILDVDPDGDAFGQATAVGTMTRAMLFHPPTRVRSAAVRFRPGGAAPFLRLPAHVLTDRVVEAGDADARWLAPADSDAQSDPVAAVAALERRLLARLQAIDGLDRAVAHAIGRLFSAAPPSIDELGRELGWSRQHLARRFRTAVGVGPKQLARVARMQRAVDHLQRDIFKMGTLGGLALHSAPPPHPPAPALRATSPNPPAMGSGGGPAYAPRASTLAGAAAELGYFDQAHMARDFRELAGLAPRDIRAARGSIFPIRSLWEAP